MFLLKMNEQNTFADFYENLITGNEKFALVVDIQDDAILEKIKQNNCKIIQFPPLTKSQFGETVELTTKYTLPDGSEITVKKTVDNTIQAAEENNTTIEQADDAWTAPQV